MENIIKSGLDDLFSELEANEKVTKLSSEESQKINCEINTEMESFNIVFKEHQIKSQISASRTFLTF